MQPYFFPYIGYFQLINAVDRFILLDTVQFIRHGWIERNRILKQNEGWLYIKVPLRKHGRDTLIKDIYIREENWQQKIIAQLSIYKKKAPYYCQTIELILEIFEEIKTTFIVEFNLFALEKICSYIGVTTPISVFSEMNLDIENVCASDEWALNISKAMKANTYINPIGGLNIFDKSKFECNGIKLKFIDSLDFAYNQKRSNFETGLSIIDVMMFNSPEAIREMLDNYELE